MGIGMLDGEHHPRCVGVPGTCTCSLLSLEDQILKLALLAVEDDDAFSPLGDEILQSGWVDWRAISLLIRSEILPSRWRSKLLRKALIDRFRQLASRGANVAYYVPCLRRGVYLDSKLARSEFARAVAASLLFKGWDLLPWPCVDKSRPRLPFCWICSRKFHGKSHRLMMVDGQEVPVHARCARDEGAQHYLLPETKR